MEQVFQRPMPGDIVICFPGNPEETEGLPAIVVQASESLTVNLQMFSMNDAAPNVLKSEVKHKSEAEKGLPYWDWPTTE